MPQAEGAAAASILIPCRDSLGLSAPRQAEPGCPSAGLSRSPTWCRDHPSTPTAGPGLRGFGVSMIYAIFDLISILSHPARPFPAPGGAPRSGRGRTPLFGFKRSSGRGGLGRRIPAGSRLRSRLQAVDPGSAMVVPARRVKTEYMKRFKEPKWESCGACYLELLHYRLSRRLLEQAHRPWLWDGWEQDSGSGGGSTAGSPSPPGAGSPAGPREEQEEAAAPGEPGRASPGRSGGGGEGGHACPGARAPSPGPALPCPSPRDRHGWLCPPGRGPGPIPDPGAAGGPARLIPPLRTRPGAGRAHLQPGPGRACGESMAAASEVSL